MNVRHARHWSALVLLFPALVLLAGCSKSTKPKEIPRPVVVHRDADDIAQMLATTLSSDNGGWYRVMKAMAETLSVPAPNPSAVFANTGGYHSAGWSPFGGGAQIYSTFAINGGTPPGVTYNLNCMWVRNDASATVNRDTLTDHLEAYVGADGGVFTNANGLTGSYGMHAGASFDTTSWGYTVYNLRPAGTDTLDFSMIVDDTCFAAVTSTMNAGENPRLWYLDDFFDFSIHIPRASLVTSPYPVNPFGNDSEVNWIITAYPLSTPGRNDYVKNSDILCEAKMTFGTYPGDPQSATLTIADTIDDPSFVYTYKVNLNTGVTVRTN